MNAEITPTEDGPLHAQHILALKNSRGETIGTGDSIYLCRCGQSRNKPYCDGSHSASGFSGKRLRGDGGPPSEFVGKDVTVVDDFSQCAHAGECVDGAPDTFFTKEGGRRVSHPDDSPAEQVMATIRKCPSGSLLYKLRGKLVDDYFTETEVIVTKDGPYHVHCAKLGGDCQPATSNHYTLCRCGASMNKPFCDGMHAKVAFTDESVG